MWAVAFFNYCDVGQLFSFPFFYVTLFFTVHNFCQGFVLATLGPQVHSTPSLDGPTQLSDSRSLGLCLLASPRPAARRVRGGLTSGPFDQRPSGPAARAGNRHRAGAGRTGARRTGARRTGARRIVDGVMRLCVRLRGDAAGTASGVMLWVRLWTGRRRRERSSR